MRMCIGRKWIKGMALAAALGIVLGLAGCGGETTQKQPPAFGQVSEAVVKVLDKEGFRENTLEDVQKLYGLDSALFADGMYYMAQTNLSANELLLVKVKDKKDLEQVKKAVEERLKVQKESFETYLPQEYTLLEKSRLTEKEDMLLFVVSKDAEAIQKAFESAWK